MTKWLWSIAIICLLTGGCTVARNAPYHDQEYAESSDQEELEVNAKQESRPAETERVRTEPRHKGLDAVPKAAAAPSASPTPVPAPTPTPAAKPMLATPSPAPVKKPAPKKAAPEATKKRAVAVQQNQGQARGAARRLTLSQLALKYPDTFKLRGSSQEKKVALTFDDGPDTRFTPKVLDVLKANQVKATFFLLGSQASAYPDVVQRIVREGHVIGNHSYSHANMPKLSVEKFQYQIERTENILQSQIGYAPKLIRPPYGAINEEQVQWVASHRYMIVNWNVDSLDWKSLKSDQVLQNIMRQTKPGSIILQHSGGADTQDLSGTVQALGPLISQLKAAGYSFVTVPELLHVTKNK